MAESNLPGEVAALMESERVAVARRRRQLAIAAGALVILMVVLWRPFAGGSDGTVKYRTENATTDRLIVTVNATGTLQPTNEVDVGSELSGIVDTVEVDYNDHVTKGQVLARLDTLKLTAESLQSKAELAAAEATLNERRASVVESEAEMNRMSAVRTASGG